MVAQNNIVLVQQALVGLLQVFDRCCKQNGLRYYITSGTALGAVRHKGFVPWDDDIDVVMPRADYDKLLSGRIAFPPPDRYVAYQNDNLLFGRFEDTETHVVHGSEAWDKIEPYLSIDIFALDGAPSKRLLRWSHFVRCYSLFAAIKLKRIDYIQSTEGLKNRQKTRPRSEQWLIRHGRALKKLFCWLDEDVLVDKFYAETSRYDYDASSIVGPYSGRYRYREFFSKEIVGDGRCIEFEGLTVSCYSRIEEYLELLYGNGYMEVPPNDMHERHGDIRLDI